jgi:hypothetical protein
MWCSIVISILGMLLGFRLSVVLAADAPSQITARFIDPFAYCAAVGTLDTLDSRYVGPQVPEAVWRGLQQALNMPTTDRIPPALEHAIWRCMGGKVHACTVGANLPCQSKADSSRTPTPGMGAFCRENPNTETIPAAVTGRETIYAWRCTDGLPVVIRAVTQPDAQGFLSHIWYAIPPR